jgi:hypothetical protein
MSSWISCLWQVLQRLAFSFLIRFGCPYWYIMMSKIPTTKLLWYGQCLVFANWSKRCAVQISQIMLHNISFFDSNSK